MSLQLCPCYAIYAPTKYFVLGHRQLRSGQTTRRLLLRLALAREDGLLNAIVGSSFEGLVEWAMVVKVVSCE